MSCISRQKINIHTQARSVGVVACLVIRPLLIKRFINNLAYIVWTKPGLVHTIIVMSFDALIVAHPLEAVRVAV